MPSLRRTISSPAVRSSPYPALSSAVSGGVAARSSHRRSMGSETSTRRVLADIEWWRVTDGQCEADIDQESNRDQAPDSPSGPGSALEELLSTSVLFSTGIGADHSIMVPLAVGPDESAQAFPINEFAALSISPQTPTRRGHTRTSSVSSMDPTPEATQPATFDGLRLSMPDIDLDPSELPIFPVLRLGAGSSAMASPLYGHGHSFLDVLSFGSDNFGCYADFSVSPLCAAPQLCN
ncbi:hypothetical protein C0993_005892 [Termitomyces sp. T159_Od127]|nr:hypothetical protein C0993_005892 [Termitomyces sp. T159_Od127]